MTHNFSTQQAAFYNWAVNPANSSSSCNLIAVAGAGKTFTLLRAAKDMPGNVGICAYNKKIADEIKGKLERDGVDWRQVQAGTVHSYGFGAYRKTFGSVKVNEYKVADIIQSIAAASAANEKYGVFSSVIVKTVSFAKQRALGILTPIDSDEAWIDIVHHFDVLSDIPEDTELKLTVRELVQMSRHVLEESNKVTDIIDFDDMVYLPVLYKCRFFGFDTVIIDEAQDTNPARRALVRAMVKRGGRVIAVGDPHQSVYGFTGADSDSLDLIAKDFNAIAMPLTVSFRCAKNVVAFARQWVDHIEAAPGAPEGTVTEVAEADFLKRSDLIAGNAVLCRNTKPLVTLAFRLIRNKVACNIEGRDLASGLIKLATRWKRVKTVNALEDKLQAYLDKQTTFLLAKKAETKLQALEDQIESIRVIIDQCRAENKDQVEDVVDYINGLFKDGIENVLVLSTIHKSKGREWETVFWYDRKGTCPSKWARQKWQEQQEINLMYVAATRAMKNLVEVLA